ncbi:MAG TPA: VTT domain-containing protein [Caulobacteraceae bacterium]|nr:VTT domain-containing protein [Caulobacteraceae bacterium]
MRLGGLARRSWPLLVIGALAVGAIVSGVWRRLSFSELRADHVVLAAAVAHHPALGLLCYAAIFTIVVVSCVPGPGMLCVAGGFLFGSLVGGSAALASCVVGSAVVFGACRTAFGDWAATRAGRSVRAVEATLSKNAFTSLLTLRLMPFLPYFAVTVAAGLARVRPRTFAAATLIGSAPVCFLLARLGDGLRVVFEQGGRIDAHVFQRPRILAPLLGLAVLSAAPLAWRLMRARMRFAASRRLAASLPRDGWSSNGTRMAEAAPTQEPQAKAGPRFFPFRGLSARLLLLTVLIVVVANLLILPPNLAAFEEQRLLDRLRAAELATLVEETAPNGVVTARVSEKLLASAGVVSVALGVENERRLVLQAPRLKRTPYLVDLRRSNPMSWLAPFQTLLGGGDRMVRVMARPRFRPGEFVEIVAPDGPLRRDLLAQLGRLLGIAAFTSVMAGAVVYLSLNFFLVRPMQRITRSMERFRADPENPASHIAPSGRHDEIGTAERELDRMQADLRVALSSRARLAALGEAVAKINHDLRNMLTSAQIASERMALSGDPKVTQAFPRLERALDRAITLASNVLSFGKSEEPPPEKRSVALRAALDAAAEDAGLSEDGVKLETAIGSGEHVEADPEQLHRILVNLLRNAREAIDGRPVRPGVGGVVAALRREEGAAILSLADDGPGLPERARANLFAPFTGSARRGGTGLGLAIARELAQGHGGDLTLVETSPAGSVFALRLPDPPPVALAGSGAPTPAA